MGPSKTLTLSTLFLTVPLLLAAIPRDPPPPVQLTADELATLADGEVVVRMEVEGETGGGATGIVDVSATPDRALDALLDLEARVGEIKGLEAVSTYDRQPDGMGARWQLQVFTTEVVFHNRYDIDRPRGWVRFSLDPDHDNDLVLVEGAYQVYAHEGGTRIVYRSETDSGRRIPRWVKRWLASQSLTQQLTGVARRAEATP